MSICNNFEGALMKAIRSLEQHVDSLMSYDFSGRTREELLEELKRWMISACGESPKPSAAVSARSRFMS